jgi:signal transduction histidine kinase
MAGGNALRTLLERWRGQPLVPQFVAAGAAVMVAAMLVIGSWTTARIQQAVVDNTAAAAALYLESFVSPLSQELAAGNALSDPARRALAEVFATTGVRDRIVSFKIWKQGGLVAHASDPAIVGRRFPPTEELARAWRGEVAGSFEHLDDPESAAEAALGVPLLEVYSPIREVWSGDVVAVAEFYERADALERDLAAARRASWLVVAGVFLASGLMLFGIVRAGGRTIARQAASLRAQVAESRRIAALNRELRDRAVNASARAGAQAERTLRRVGADLHDGPAQYVALAAMRLDSLAPDTEAGRLEAVTVRAALDAALAEIRAISRGLALPDLDALGLREIVERAVDPHRHGAELAVSFEGPDDAAMDASARICLYRFLQEALANALRHASGAPVAVRVRVSADAVTASVSDAGPGFDPAAIRVRPDGGSGLAGLRDRAESIGGGLEIVARPGAGATLTLTLPRAKGT